MQNPVKIALLGLSFILPASVIIPSGSFAADHGAASLNGYSTSDRSQLPAENPNDPAVQQQEQRQLTTPGGGLSAAGWAFFMVVVGAALIYSARVNTRRRGQS